MDTRTLVAFLIVTASSTAAPERPGVVPGFKLER